MANIEETINDRLRQFTLLGKVAKSLKGKRKHKELLIRVYIGMTHIAIELDVVKAIIFEQHPNLAPLFESLIELYGYETKGM